MKRSSTVAALLLGGVSPLLFACGEDGPQEAAVYPSIEACASELPADDCSAAFTAAREEHQDSAPRFSSREACDAEVGDAACVPQMREDGSLTGVFIPALVGFMVGRSLTGSYAQPVYFDRQGFARSGTTQIGRLSNPERGKEERPQGSSGGSSSSSGSSGSYYRPGGNTGRPIAVATTARSAGFGSTGASRGFSGS